MTRRQRVRMRKARNRTARYYGWFYPGDHTTQSSRATQRSWSYWEVIAFDRVNCGCSEGRIRHAYARARREDLRAQKARMS